MAILTAVIECPLDGTEFEATWPIEGDIQDLDGPPVIKQVCPEDTCGHAFDAEYPGWHSFTEAG